MTAPGVACARKTSRVGTVIIAGSSPHPKCVRLPFRLQFPDRPVCCILVWIRADDDLVVVSRLSPFPFHHGRLPSVLFQPIPKRLGRGLFPEGGDLNHQFPHDLLRDRRRRFRRCFPRGWFHEKDGIGLLLRQGFAKGDVLFGFLETCVGAGRSYGGNLSRLLREDSEIFPDLRLGLLPVFDRSLDFVRLVSAPLRILFDDPAHLEAKDEHHGKQDDGSDYEEGKRGPLPVCPSKPPFPVVQGSHIRSGAETPIRERPVETIFRTALARASRPWVRSGVSPRNRWLW